MSQVILKKTKLIYMVHGFGADKSNLSDLQDLLRKEHPQKIPNSDEFQTDIICNDHPHKQVFCRQRAADIVQNILTEIDALYAQHNYDEIVLTGHSMGATLVRRALIEATGLSQPVDLPTTSSGDDGSEAPINSLKNPSEYELINLEHLHSIGAKLRSVKAIKSRPAIDFNLRREWAEKVTHLVLIASMGRGWTLDTASGFTGRAIGGIGQFIGAFCGINRAPVIFDIRLGSPFVTQTRLRWLQMQRAWAARKEPRNLKVIKMVGSVDGRVPPYDAFDLNNEDGSKRSKKRKPDIDTVIVGLPYTNHSNIVWVDQQNVSQKDKQAAIQRREIFTKIFSPQSNLRAAKQENWIKNVITPEELTQRQINQDRSVTDVFFLIHGIRDFGFWTEKIENKIYQKMTELKSDFAKNNPDQPTPKFKVLRPSYGYLPMFPFLFPMVRRRKVEWFMHQYTLARLQYPAAKFHYMGHSNGTYLCAEALKLYPMAAFDRIMFAGSVVRQDYEWDILHKMGRMKNLLNFVSTKDVVVAWLPNAFRTKIWPFKLFDLGGAGHDGFDQAKPENQPKDEDPYICELYTGDADRYHVIGGHRAGRDEAVWTEIADFLVNGNHPKVDENDPQHFKKINKQEFSKNQPFWMKTLGVFAPLTFSIGKVALILVAFFALTAPIFTKEPSDELIWVIDALRQIRPIAWGVATYMLFATLTFITSDQLEGKLNNLGGASNLFLGAGFISGIGVWYLLSHAPIGQDFAVTPFLLGLIGYNIIGLVAFGLISALLPSGWLRLPARRKPILFNGTIAAIVSGLAIKNHFSQTPLPPWDEVYNTYAYWESGTQLSLTLVIALMLYTVVYKL